MADTKVQPGDIHAMVRHWLSVPVYGYLGSDYGNDLKAVLQTPQAGGLADAQLAKLRRDVPVTQFSRVNMYARKDGVDRLQLVIDVNGQDISFGGQ